MPEAMEGRNREPHSKLRSERDAFDHEASRGEVEQQPDREVRGLQVGAYLGIVHGDPATCTALSSTTIPPEATHVEAMTATR